VLLRPEDLHVVPTPEGIDATVETCAFFGSYYAVTARSGVGTIRAHVAEAIAPNQSVRISWPETAGIAYPAVAAQDHQDIDSLTSA
jgi:hypothetical protein